MTRPTAYKIGNDILIHTSDNLHWELTCETLSIYSLQLCRISMTNQEVARYVYVILNERRQLIQRLIDDVFPNT